MPRRRCPSCDQSTDAQFSSCEFCGHRFQDADALPPAPVGEAATLDPAVAAASAARDQELRAIADAALAVVNPFLAVNAVIAAKRAERGGAPGVVLRARIAATVALLIAVLVFAVAGYRLYLLQTFPDRMEARAAELHREVEAITGPIPNDSDLANAAAVTSVEEDLDHDRISDVAVSAREVKVFQALREAAAAGHVTQGQLRVVSHAVTLARGDHMVDPDEATRILDACDRILASAPPAATSAP